MQKEMQESKGESLHVGEEGFYENIDINFSQQKVFKKSSFGGFSRWNFLLNILVGFCAILAKSYYLCFLKSCKLTMKMASASFSVWPLSKVRNHSFHRWLCRFLTLSYLIFWKYWCHNGEVSHQSLPNYPQGSQYFKDTSCETGDIYFLSSLII